MGEPISRKPYYFAIMKHEWSGNIKYAQNLFWTKFQFYFSPPPPPKKVYDNFRILYFSTQTFKRFTPHVRDQIWNLKSILTIERKCPECIYLIRYQTVSCYIKSQGKQSLPWNYVTHENLSWETLKSFKTLKYIWKLRNMVQNNGYASLVWCLSENINLINIERLFSMISKTWQFYKSTVGLEYKE